jgi:hypothetical protein
MAPRPIVGLNTSGGYTHVVSVAAFRNHHTITMELRAAVSATGAVVAGTLDGGGFYRMPTTGVIYTGSQTDRMSGDGRTIVGTVADSRGIRQAAIWQHATEWR